MGKCNCLNEKRYMTKIKFPVCVCSHIGLLNGDLIQTEPAQTSPSAPQQSLVMVGGGSEDNRTLLRRLGGS